MTDARVKEFLQRHGMDPADVDPAALAKVVCEDMENGLHGRPSAMPMIPTYIGFDGDIPVNEPVVVIDAGGTNFRCGLASFTGSEWRLEQLKRQRMPGVDAPVSWETFIAFVADQIQLLLTEADKISFCFSYNADITPEIDGLVKSIDKEVIVTGSSGKLVGASLLAELEKRGINGKRVLILNDTVAALLGASSLLDKKKYSGFAGQISGTGANTCCVLPHKRIGKLHRSGDETMLINMESGLFNKLPQGDFDVILDRESQNTGEKILEKQIAGAYIGKLGKLSLSAAAEEGYLSTAAANKLSRFEKIESADVDAWSSGKNLDAICDTPEDRDFVTGVCKALFERAAKYTCATLTGIMLLTGAGTDPEKPMCVCAEGSLVDKSTHFKPMLTEALETYGAQQLGHYATLQVGRETTLPGSAVAALLNF